jgi:hypothetical protein
LEEDDDTLVVKRFDDVFDDVARRRGGRGGGGEAPDRADFVLGQGGDDGIDEGGDTLIEEEESNTAREDFILCQGEIPPCGGEFSLEGLESGRGRVEVFPAGDDACV